MAPIAMILGGIGGTVSAIFGWLLFGLSFWAAVQLYFAVALTLAGLMIMAALLRRPRAKPARKGKRRGRSDTADLQRA